MQFVEEIPPRRTRKQIEFEKQLAVLAGSPGVWADFGIVKSAAHGRGRALKFIDAGCEHACRTMEDGCHLFIRCPDTGLSNISIVPGP